MKSNLTITSIKNILINTEGIEELAAGLSEELNFTIIDIEIIFVDSKFIHQINSKHLNHNYSTDIITFNYSDKSYSLEGEIYISVEDAEKNAKYFENSLEEEILRLVIHGFLHMLGFDDQTADEKQEMKQKEDALVRKYIEFTKRISITYDREIG